jgi:hypothetical protein
MIVDMMTADINGDAIRPLPFACRDGKIAELA